MRRSISVLSIRRAVFPHTGILIFLLALLLFCLSAASHDWWPQSVLLFHLDSKLSRVPFWPPFQNANRSHSKVLKASWKGVSVWGWAKALMMGAPAPGPPLSYLIVTWHPAPPLIWGWVNPKILILSWDAPDPPSHSNVKSKRCIYPLWSLADLMLRACKCKTMPKVTAYLVQYPNKPKLSRGLVKLESVQLSEKLGFLEETLRCGVCD